MHLYITFHSLMNVALKDKWDVWLENYLLLFGHYLIAIKFYTMLSIFFQFLTELQICLTDLTQCFGVLIVFSVGVSLFI